MIVESGLDFFFEIKKAPSEILSNLPGQFCPSGPIFFPLGSSNYYNPFLRFCPPGFEKLTASLICTAFIWLGSSTLLQLHLWRVFKRSLSLPHSGCGFLNLLYSKPLHFPLLCFIFLLAAILLYELGCVNLTIQYPRLFKSCLNSGSLTCQLLKKFLRSFF